ncbi:MAG TPA: cytochrome c maturation protein CcmE, partial [Longimicrobiales bacterium]
MTKKKGPSIGLILTLLVVLGGFGYLIYGGLDDNLVYFLTPSELMAKGDSAHGKPVRLGGMVVPGTVKWDAKNIDLRFTLSDTKGKIDVHSKKAPPQMFREGQGVVVEGRLANNGIFESTSLMVKHSNEYKAPHDAEKPEDAYKTLIKPQ